MTKIFQWVEGIEDTATRAEAAGAVIDMVQERLEQPLADLRADAIRMLKAEGWSYSSLAEAFNLSRARLHQLVNPS